MARKTLFALLCSVIVMSLAGFANATMVLPLDLKAMSAQSGKIFVGRCRETAAELDENRLPSTVARFEVLKGIKGVADGEEVVIKQYGVSRSPMSIGEGEKALVAMKTMTLGGGGYSSGEDYLLFLYPESSLGFTSPVGAGQGMFEIFVGAGSPRPGADTAPLQTLAVNPINNRFLRSFPDGPVPVDDLVREIRKWVKP